MRDYSESHDAVPLSVACQYQNEFVREQNLTHGLVCGFLDCLEVSL